MAGFGDISFILSGISKLLKLQNTSTPTIPTPLILFGAQRKKGLSASKIASEIISRKGEAGIPVGALPSGQVSQDEIMERIRAEVIIKNLQEDSIITVAIPPGSTVVSAGASPSGPVSTVGQTTSITTGYGQLS